MKKILKIALLFLTLSALTFVMYRSPTIRNLLPSRGSLALPAAEKSVEPRGSVTVYRWTDANGSVVFSDKKPGHGRFEAITVDPAVNVFEFGDAGALPGSDKKAPAGRSQTGSR